MKNTYSQYRWFQKLVKVTFAVAIILNFCNAFADNLTSIKKDITSLNNEVVQLQTAIKGEHEFNEGRYSTAKGLIDEALVVSSIILTILAIYISMIWWKVAKNLETVEKHKTDIQELINNNGTHIYNNIIEHDILTVTNKIAENYKYIDKAESYLDIRPIKGETNKNNLRQGYLSLKNNESTLFYNEPYSSTFFYFFVRDYLDYFCSELLEDYKQFLKTPTALTAWVLYQYLRDNKPLAQKITNLIITSLKGKNSEEYNKYIEEIITANPNSFNDLDVLFNKILYFSENRFKQNT